MKAVVCGAGIAGLAVAQRLSTLGWEVVVLEKASGPRTQGYMIDFFGLVLRADLLVGADGVHSRVRDLVFGPEADYLRYLGFPTAAFTFRDTAVSDTAYAVSPLAGQSASPRHRWRVPAGRPPAQNHLGRAGASTSTSGSSAHRRREATSRGEGRALVPTPLQNPTAAAPDCTEPRPDTRVHPVRRGHGDRQGRHPLRSEPTRSVIAAISARRAARRDRRRRR